MRSLSHALFVTCLACVRACACAEFDALIAKRKSGKGGFSLQLYTELLGRVSACLDFNAACFLLECLKKDALPLGDEVWQHVQRMLARSRHDRSAVRGIPKVGLLLRSCSVLSAYSAVCAVLCCIGADRGAD